jgi:AcrR family transcriptional regulator
MADVAARAGVSRQTLYNGFGSRADLARAYVTREAEAFVEAVEEAIRARADAPANALASALELFLGAAGTHPLVRAITSPDGGEELLPLVTTRGAPVVAMVTDRLAAVLLETWPQLTDADAATVADVLARLAISYATLPSGSARATAASTARLLGPSLDTMLTPSASRA